MIKLIKSTSAEAKRVDYSWPRSTLYHNGGASVVPTIWSFMSNATNSVWCPSQGDGDGQRDGNDIYVSGVTLRMQWNLPQDRLNTKMRCIVIRTPRGVNVATYTNIFDNVTGNSMLDPIDKDRCQVLKQFYVYQKTINPSAGSVGKEATLYRKIFIPIKRTIKFLDDAGQDNMLEWDYHLLMYAYDTYGSLPGDAVSYCQLWQRTHFKG